MAKTRKKRQTYTPQQRQQILAAAAAQSLTAAQVKRKFGVTPVTYYSWRKKSGATRRRAGVLRAKVAVGAGGLGNLRAEVQARVRQILPDVVRTEVNSFLDTLFSSNAGRKRRQRV